jgi:hypothetical protein
LPAGAEATATTLGHQSHFPRVPKTISLNFLTPLFL